MSEPFVNWAVARHAYPGESESGDRHVVLPFETGVLLGVVDGLGHGEEAAKAARTAVEILEAHPTERLVALVRRCHEGLVRSRGVVMSLATYDAVESKLTWVGIGNVEGVLLRADRPANRPGENLVLRRGVLGLEIPQVLHTWVISISPGDTLVLATDGVRSDFVWNVARGRPPQQMADRILAFHRRQDDDALALVVEFRGVGQ